MPKIIVFTGLDGTGKTTHSHLAKEYLEDKGYSVKLIHHFEPVKIFKPIIEKFSSELIELERSSSNKEIFKDNQKHSSIPSLYSKINKNRIILSGLSKSWYRYLMNFNKDFIIYDRYYYDDIIKINWMYDSITDKKLKIFIELVPKPDLFFYLKVHFNKAWSREEKGSTDIKQHKNKFNEYENFTHILKENNFNFYNIDTTRPIEESRKIIKGKINKIV